MSWLPGEGRNLANELYEGDAHESTARTSTQPASSSATERNARKTGSRQRPDAGEGPHDQHRSTWPRRHHDGVRECARRTYAAIGRSHGSDVSPDLVETFDGARLRRPLTSSFDHLKSEPICVVADCRRTPSMVLRGTRSGGRFVPVPTCAFYRPPSVVLVCPASYRFGLPGFSCPRNAISGHRVANKRIGRREGRSPTTTARRHVPGVRAPGSCILPSSDQ